MIGKKVLLLIVASLLVVSNFAACMPSSLGLTASSAKTSAMISTSGLLTGRIFDKGIDKDGNGLFDNLQIKVEVNITSAGTYSASIYALENDTEWPNSYVYVSDSKTVNLNAGVQNATLSFYGPIIQASSETNLSFVSSISVYSQFSSQNDYMQGIALSRSYSFSEFDSSFTDMKATFRVFPNGTVNMAGSFNATRMPSPGTGINVNGSVGVSSTGDSTTVSTSENMSVPPDMESQWPFNASTASVTADYSKQTGNLNVGLNSTVMLQPGSSYNQGMSPYRSFYASQYPWNSSDFSLNIVSSNGIATGELQAQTSLPSDPTSVLPPDVTWMFPFSATDYTIKANYLAGSFKGNATFHTLSGFPLGDLNVNFEGSRTQATMSGSVTLVYGTYPTITLDEAYVDAMIGNITIREGTGPDSLFNETNGMVELSSTSSITKTPILTPPGATVGFNMILNGDPVALFAFVMSGGNSYSITYSGVFRILNATVTSFNSASIQTSYFRGTQTATLDLKFVADLNKLVATLFAFPENTWPMIIRSSSMSPTLEIGDIVLVENVTDASTIRAAPYPDGDIIAFENPENLSAVIVHRTIDVTLWNSTLYFQTQGDYNYAPDYWSGPQTYNGMISEKLILGKVVERVPYVGNLYLTVINSLGLPGLIQGKNIPQLAKDLVPLAKSLNLQLTYASSNSTLDVKLTSVFDAEGFRNTITPQLPDVVDPSLKDFFTGLSTNFYANVTSGQGTFTYKNGTARSQATITLKGDAAQEINYLKTLFVNVLLNRTSPEYVESLLIINATNLDVHNLTATFSMVGDSEFVSFDGFQASPPIDQIDAASFKLSRFFNLTKSMNPYSTEMPRDREKMMLTLQCVGSGVNILTLTAPSTIPSPNTVSEDHTLMVWNNQSVSGLGDVIFSIQGYIGVTGQAPVIINSNGTVSTATLDSPHNRINLTVDGPHGSTGFVNVSIPTSVLNSPPNSWTIVVGGRTVLYPDYQIVNTTTRTYLYFTFNFSSLITIQIVGTISEFPNTVLLLLIIATATVIIGTKFLPKIRRMRFAGAHRSP